MANTMLVYAGPNGSGKSSITKKVPPIGRYVNADVIQKDLGCSAKEAADNADRTRWYLLDNNIDFSFESVLSVERNVLLMEEAKARGWHVICIYILTCDPCINVRRVKKRYSCGGHNVPEDDVVRRYDNALRLIPRVVSACDELYIFDNSEEAGVADGKLIAHKSDGDVSICPSKIWDEKMISSLLAGKYPDEYIHKE